MNDLYHYPKIRIQQESDPIRRRDLILGYKSELKRDKNPDIDDFREWLNMQFQICMQEIQSKPQKQTSRTWEPLFKELATEGYISGNPEVFDYVIKHKQLPPGERIKIKWLALPGWWRFFADAFGFKPFEFKKCFEHPKGGIFHSNNRSRKPKDKKFRDIIKKYSDQKTDPSKT